MSIKILLVFLLVFGVACGSQSAEVRTGKSNEISHTGPATRQPVLVELFTSEGCSSCPPADRNTAFLENNQPVPTADIITLAFHVDYWDGPEWKDEFSSSIYSQRQNDYGEVFKLDAIYTPEMVVDGQSEFVGSDSGKATKAIAAAASVTKGTIAISPDQDKFKIAVSALGKHGDATAYLAVAEDNIKSNVRGGENAGSSFVHMSVVREFDTLGKIGADADNVAFQTQLSKNKDWQAENLKYVAFVQENSTRKILAVTKFSR
ncbi:MAG TPA: DUF1223 domain-containing protein [Pyrinomonadaceae bacterium]|nr:DUF1223 domain-containing protein [Pyrinomonadaceae bacterium]